jgi:molybdenum cofactor cytidylyltransferase
MISAIVLAAGKSTRIGVCKQLLKLKGKSMIEHTISNVKKSSVDEIIVVLGFMASEISKVVRGNKIVVNNDYGNGLSYSLKKGLKAVNKHSEAVIFILADQPLINGDVINLLISHYRKTGAKIIVPLHEGKRGNPVLIDKSLFYEINNLTGDIGARFIIKKNEECVSGVDVNTNTILIDIDTEGDYLNVKKKLMYE